MMVTNVDASIARSCLLPWLVARAASASGGRSSGGPGRTIALYGRPPSVAPRTTGRRAAIHITDPPQRAVRPPGPWMRRLAEGGADLRLIAANGARHGRI